MDLFAVILAAGQGKRMKTRKPKVLHEVLGKPILQYAVDAVKALKPERLVIVVGNGAGEVKEQITDRSVSFVTQKKLLGTGNALLEAKNALRGMNNCTLIVLNGDSPLITSNTLKKFLRNHRRSNNDLSLLSFIDGSLAGYGRILRDSRGRVSGIIEDKHASANEKKELTELNAGIYAIEPDILGFLSKLKKRRLSGEYYLTDIVDIAVKERRKVEAYYCPAEEVMGINTRTELHKALETLNKRNILKLMDSGVTFINPSSSFVHSSVKIGKDTVVYPNTYIEGNTSIGRNCIIDPGVRIIDSTISDKVSIKDHSIIENSRISKGSVIGPSAHIRPLSNIGRNVKIGNFVEIKKSNIGDGTKISHLSYIGDALVGQNVNIGAGTITCNYDGRKKYKTIIRSDVFIGSDSQIVAPVLIGKGAYIAAGATVTKNVPAGALAISRAGQKNIRGWAVKGQLKGTPGK